MFATPKSARKPPSQRTPRRPIISDSEDDD